MHIKFSRIGMRPQKTFRFLLHFVTYFYNILFCNEETSTLVRILVIASNRNPIQANLRKGRIHRFTCLHSLRLIQANLNPGTLMNLLRMGLSQVWALLSSVLASFSDCLSPCDDDRAGY